MDTWSMIGQDMCQDTGWNALQVWCPLGNKPQRAGPSPSVDQYVAFILPAYTAKVARGKQTCTAADSFFPLWVFHVNA